MPAPRIQALFHHRARAGSAPPGPPCVSLRLPFLVLAVLALASPAAAAGIPIRMEERELRAAGIELAPVQPEPGTTDISLPGVAAVPPHQLRIVAAPAAGLVEAMLAAPDERVAAGQPLARLRSNELVEAQRAFLEALTRDALARNKLWRDEALLRERIIAERRVLTTRAEAEAARATLDERRQLLALLGMAQADVRALAERREIAPALAIASPAAGVVLQRQAAPGERVAQAAPLFTVAQVDPLWVSLQAPLSVIGALGPGARVSLPAQGLEGTVLRLGQSVDPATQSVAVVAEVQGTTGRLRPGQVAQVTVALEPNGVAQWRVPAGAVVRHRERPWVFVRTPEGFAATPVTLVAETAQSASIRAELATGDRVAARGLLTLLATLAGTDRD
ncbi:efflux RND transporter periplasmic adaptor subunit [Roseicella aquatilis]|uniref:Efflux RND transporter periplasmic adaptor subunit n=1 Tax=Roseicella aquatilis TaxID=2527868 RepID=A0A4V2WJH4_9PROT|nr:efflux RND transporter periplasmic adaptor subunit [Roseicella aquatilis]TCZ53413.1 efflux RND transporter periplasmic adaptor subunit [Roseicella aquatilis]